MASLESICPPLDRRGKHSSHLKISDAIKKQIDEHIRSFSVMKSHYSRSHHNKHRKYLSPLLSVADMHELYLQKYEAAGTNIVSYGYYLKYFNFNLSFGYPKSDACCTCDGLQIQLEAADDTQKVGIMAQKEDYLRRAKNFYSSLCSNTNMTKTNVHIATVTFDFQQNLPLPHIPVGEVFYTHQLWLYVFGVHNCGTKQGLMYCWPEFTANIGSDEVVSCLDRYLSSLPEDVTTLYLYSDRCPGQNKNLTAVHYLFALVQLGKFHHIQHHFPVRGHLFLPNDRDFGCTELKKKKTEQINGTIPCKVLERETHSRLFL